MCYSTRRQQQLKYDKIHSFFESDDFVFYHDPFKNILIQIKQIFINGYIFFSSILYVCKQYNVLKP